MNSLTTPADATSAEATSSEATTPQNASEATTPSALTTLEDYKAQHKKTTLGTGRVRDAHNTAQTLTLDDIAQLRQLDDLLAAQKAAFLADCHPSLAERIHRVERVQKLLVDHQDAICDAISRDYGNRSKEETLMSEVLSCIGHCHYVIKHLSEWIKPQKRQVNALFMPARAMIEYSPLGVVGIISPWNYPLFLAISPLIFALAAGNRAMIKTSSSSVQLGKLLKQLFSQYFTPDEVSIITGSGPISDYFGCLAFDQITFTGSTAVGKIIMKNAAENLTPVLLELGGKSPVIVHPEMPVKDAAERIMFGKLWNSGQTCIAPDYAFVAQEQVENFIEQAKYWANKYYPTIKHNEDYTSIINDKQYKRLQDFIEDARSKGARIVELSKSTEDLSDVRKIAPLIITHLTDDMRIAQEEIFGPILLVYQYAHLDEAIAFINKRPHPLALYYMDYDTSRARYISERTRSGHFGVNDVITHFAQDDLAVGGVGASGMGKYHGHEGFVTMSNARSVLIRPRFYAIGLILPPFKPKRAVLKMLLKRTIR